MRFVAPEHVCIRTDDFFIIQEKISPCQFFKIKIALTSQVQQNGEIINQISFNRQNSNHMSLIWLSRWRVRRRTSWRRTQTCSSRPRRSWRSQSRLVQRFQPILETYFVAFWELTPIKCRWCFEINRCPLKSSSKCHLCTCSLWSDET